MRFFSLTILCVASLLIISGCAQPKPNKKAVVDQTLPVVEFTRNATVVDMNAIALEWKNITDPRVEGLYIYKLAPESEDGKFSYYDTIANRFSTHYVDLKVTPNTKYSYYFKSYSKDAESKESEVIEVSSLPVLQSVSWIYSVQNMPRSAKIIWRPHTNQKVKSYILERVTLEDDKWQRIAEIDGRLTAEYIDSELKDNYVYKYRILAHTYDDITSTPSVIVKVVTKPLPQSIENIIASRDLPKKIVVRWGKSQTEDFYHYNVYRSSKINGSYEFLTSTKNNEFVDEINEDAKEYFYRVSAVDTDDLESEYEQNSIAGTTLLKPKEPAFLEAKFVSGKIVLSWSKTDQRTVKYILSKRYKMGWFDEKNIQVKDIVSEKYTDTNIEPNAKYFYTVYSVDKFGIVSKPSIEVVIEVNENMVSNISTTNNATRIEEVKVLTQPINSMSSKQEETIIPMKDF